MLDLAQALLVNRLPAVELFPDSLGALVVCGRKNCVYDVVLEPDQEDLWLTSLTHWVRGGPSHEWWSNPVLAVRRVDELLRLGRHTQRASNGSPT